MSFGNHWLNLILTHSHIYTLNIHLYTKQTKEKKHTHKHIIIRSTHIHVKFILQIKTNRHACAPPLVFALFRYIHLYISEWFLYRHHSIPYVSIQLFVLHPYIHTYTHKCIHIKQQIIIIILYTTKNIEFDQVFILPPAKCPYLSVYNRCAACYCVGIFVRSSSMCTANLLMNFCLSDSMFSLVFKCACSNEITSIKRITSNTNKPTRT